MKDRLLGGRTFINEEQPDLQIDASSIARQEPSEKVKFFLAKRDSTDSGPSSGDMTPLDQLLAIIGHLLANIPQKALEGPIVLNEWLASQEPVLPLDEPQLSLDGKFYIIRLLQSDFDPRYKDDDVLIKFMIRCADGRVTKAWEWIDRNMHCELISDVKLRNQRLGGTWDF